MSEKRDSIGLPPPNGLEPRSERPNFVRSELSVFVGEFIGTFMFLFFAFAGTQIAVEAPSAEPDLPDASKLLYIAFSFGAALAINVVVFADISGAQFNPAVTTSLLLVGVIRWQRALHSIFAQLIAGICAAYMVHAILPGPLPVATRLGGDDISIARGLFLEVFLTTQLILAVLMIPAGPSKPLYVGIALFIGQIAGVYYTGGSLNPARSLGPSVVAGFDGYHWIYWLGPELGAALGAGVFTLVPFIRGKHHAAE